MAAVPFDRSVLKVNQVILMTLIVAAYVASFWVRPAVVVLPLLALMMLATTASPSANLPRFLYLRWLKPRGLVKPRVHQEDPAPHRFAQGVGGVFLVAASVFALFGLLPVAWILAWIVVALAFLNFAFDICVGCIVYAQLIRAGVLPLRRSAAA
jgi:Domain of unknown function (DUF4395)